MYNISKEELTKLERIGSGNFGSIYLNGDKVYKVYHESIKATNSFYGVTDLIPNPCLKYTSYKYNYLKYINSKLQYTDLIDDILLIDGKFNGIVMPYYSGETFEDHMNDEISKKVAMSRQLLVNAMELTNNLIYPLDYKENNLMLYGKRIQIIDLDDKLTKVLNPFYKRHSITVLDDAIKRFIGDVDYNSYINVDKDLIRSYLQKEMYHENKSYKEIEEYLAYLIVAHNYIIIDSNTNIEKYIELLRNPNYRVIYSYKINEDDIMEKIIKDLLAYNIFLYDMVPNYSVDELITSISYDDLIKVEDNHLVNVKKRL